MCQLKKYESNKQPRRVQWTWARPGPISINFHPLTKQQTNLCFTSSVVLQCILLNNFSLDFFISLSRTSLYLLNPVKDPIEIFSDFGLILLFTPPGRNLLQFVSIWFDQFVDGSVLINKKDLVRFVGLKVEGKILAGFEYVWGGVWQTSWVFLWIRIILLLRVFSCSFSIIHLI